jgi:Zn-dependent alcohol dehydrogenase
MSGVVAMKMKAAVLWEPKTDWSVEEVTLDPPKAGEVLVKLVGSGLCHSDEHLLTGDLALPEATQQELGMQQFPVIGGHEGAGEVLEVGPGVTSLAVGDHVVFGFILRAGGARSARPGIRTCVISAPIFSPGGR